jgi:hypothetical protein
MMEGDPEVFEAMLHRLAAMKVEHRELDQEIHRIVATPFHDDLEVQRMKRRKLLLKDQITWLERQLDPDVLA